MSSGSYIDLDHRARVVVGHLDRIESGFRHLKRDAQRLRQVGGFGSAGGDSNANTQAAAAQCDLASILEPPRKTGRNLAFSTRYPLQFGDPAQKEEKQDGVSLRQAHPCHGPALNRSIAYGIAKAARREGAELAFTYQNERFKERVTEMAGEFGSKLALPATWRTTPRSPRLFAGLGKAWDGLDGLVHAIAFAPREAIAGDFLEGMSREAFRIAHDVSAYSFAALAKAALPMMQGRNSALVTLTYLGAERVVPNYNTMGLAKASLEASVRYLATQPGTAGDPRQRHLGRSDQDPGGERYLRFREDPQARRGERALRRNVTTEEVGNVAAFLLSDLAASVTGEVIHADAGFSTVVGGMAGDAGACRPAEALLDFFSSASRLISTFASARRPSRKDLNCWVPLARPSSL